MPQRTARDCLGHRHSPVFKSERTHRSLRPFGQIPTYEEDDLRVRNRLGKLSDLGDADWLDRAFSADDLMMVAVLLGLKASSMLKEYPNLFADVARGETRPAYKRAYDAQLAVFTGKSPAG